MLVGLIGCGSAPELMADTGPPLQGVVLAAGTGPQTVTVQLAGAWLADDGVGRGVDAQATIEGSPPLTIAGKRSSWRLRDGVVVFEGEVVADRGPVHLECARLEVRYDGEVIREAVATGGVVVTRDDRRVRADHGTLTVADGRLVLEGDPRLEQGPNQLSATRITLFLDEERLECDGCRLRVSGEALRKSP